MSKVDETLARTVCVVTGTRAEFGLLRPLMELLASDPRAKLQTVVTGAHLVESLGATWQEIEQAGFPIDAKVDLDLRLDTPRGIAHSMSLGLEGLTQVLERLHPTLTVLLGDRYEALAAAQAAMLAGVPIAHLHGGEVTEGALDERIRHAVTKLAQLHFVAAEPYRRRVVQLGEDPHNVHTVGAFALDAISRLNPIEVVQLSEQVGLDLHRPFILLTYHPVTTQLDRVSFAASEVLAALDLVPELAVLATKANADPGGRIVNHLLEEWTAERSKRATLVPSLGHVSFLSAMRVATAVVGNSSSGIIEAPALGVPTVNVGDRQRGRLRATSVVDVPEDRAAIVRALQDIRAGHSPRIDPADHPYGTPGAAGRTLEVLVATPLEPLARKQFYDL